MTRPRIVTVVQARMSSSRLPGKVLMPLGGTVVINRVIENARAFSSQVVVATSSDSSDDVIEEHCGLADTVCVRGPLDEVFDRFRLALEDSRVQSSTWFARVTADCPLVSPSLARHLIDHIRQDDDVVAVRNDDVARGLPVELVRRDTFLQLDSDELDDPQREHVTLALYENPHRFNVHYVKVPPPFNRADLRLTLDYAEDLDLFRRLFAHDPDLRAEEAIARLDAEPELVKINRDVRQKPAR